MHWFWIVFMIVGTLGAIIYYKLDDYVPKSKSDFSTKEKNSSESSIKEPPQAIVSNQTKVDFEHSIDYMPKDPQKYVTDIGGHRLVHYNGDENEDILFIPLGIGIVGNDESEIQKGKKWDIVYIPRSVHTIHDLALPFVESIYYEGSAQEFTQINIGTIGNFTTGFIPNYAENMAPEYIEHAKVKKIKYTYNADLRRMYRELAEARKKKSSLIEKMHEFIYLCQEIDKLGKNYFGYYVVKVEAPMSPTHFYIKHIFHDVDNLLFAHDSLEKGNEKLVKYYYDEIINLLPPTLTQRFFLQDFSDFCDFLHGEINAGTYKYCTFKRDGLNDIIIEQHIGCCNHLDGPMIHTALKQEIDNLSK